MGRKWLPVVLNQTRVSVHHLQPDRFIASIASMGIANSPAREYASRQSLRTALDISRSSVSAGDSRWTFVPAAGSGIRGSSL
ncbi:hypothetical protein AXG89_34025 [Burkholderia sp. PAMC 26561]|nr:hypothetical protein AXG89_34025 [Burkholderia sp. PAMC 26561]